MFLRRVKSQYTNLAALLWDARVVFIVSCYRTSLLCVCYYPHNCEWTLNFLNMNQFVPFSSKWIGLDSDLSRWKLVSARAGATQSTSVFMQIWFASGKCGTDQKSPGKFSNTTRAERSLSSISFILKVPQINGVHMWFKLSLLLCQRVESPVVTEINLFPLRNVKYQMTQLFLFWSI